MVVVEVAQVVTPTQIKIHKIMVEVVEEELVVLVSLQEMVEQQVQMVLVEDLNLMEKREVLVD